MPSGRASKTASDSYKMNNHIGGFEIRTTGVQNLDKKSIKSCFFDFSSFVWNFCDNEIDWVHKNPSNVVPSCTA